MPAYKDANQVLADVHDDSANALRVLTSGSPAPTTTVLRSSTTGAGAVAITTAFAKKMRVRTITGKASGAVVEALTITLDSLTGAAYDALLQEVSAGWTDFFFQPDGELILEAGDELVLACANSGGATYGIEVIAEEAS